MLPKQKPVRPPLLSHMYYMPHPSHSPWCDHLNNVWWGNVNAFPNPFMCKCSNHMSLFPGARHLSPVADDTAGRQCTSSHGNTHTQADQQPLWNVCKHAKFCYMWQLNSGAIASMRSTSLGWLQHKGRSGHGLLLTYLTRSTGMSTLSKIIIHATVWACKCGQGKQLCE
jgi:hypothetical protein